MTTPQIIAMSGPDNVGKSTQLRILSRRLYPEARLCGPLHDYDPRWPSPFGSGLSAWWFSTAAPADLADVLARSYLARHAAATPDGLWLLDRGVPMLVASLAATLSVRLNLDDNDGHEEALRLLRPYKQDLQICAKREIGVVLLHSLDAQESAARSLAREVVVDDLYRRYQEHLAVQVLRRAAKSDFAYAIVVGDRPVMSVQDELRSALRELGVPCPPSALSRARVVAFGGMSESGKSTAANRLRQRHAFTRLKISYLLDQSARCHGIGDVYSRDAASQAELLVDALDRYLAAHSFADRITIESLHRLDATLALRPLLGSNLVIVYVETQEELRRERATEASATFTQRDKLKRSRGADRIRDIADIVLSNDSSRVRLYHHLDELALSLTWRHSAPRVASVTDLGLPASISGHVRRLVCQLTTPPVIDLVAVTGSSGRGRYQPGWSDLDMLIVADRTAWSVVRSAIAELRTSLGDIKLGLTLITSAECRAGALTPRLVHTLRQIGTGEIAVQWCAPDLLLPCPTPDDDAAISLSDGAFAAIELRRQLMRPEFEARTVFKLAALLAKVMLRVTQKDTADDEASLRSFLAEADSLKSIEALAAARADSDEAQVIAFTVLDAWLAQLPTTAGACSTS